MCKSISVVVVILLATLNFHSRDINSGLLPFTPGGEDAPVQSFPAHYCGIDFGFGSSYVDANNFLSTAQHGRSLNGAITYQLDLNSFLTIGLDLQIEQRQFYKTLVYGDTNQYLSQEREFYSLYLNTPAWVGFRTKSKHFIYGNIGVVPGFVRKVNVPIASSDTLGVEQAFGELTAHKTIKTFDLGAFVEFGVGIADYNGNNWRIFTRYQRSFMSMASDNFFPNADIIQHSWQMGLEYRFSVDWKGRSFLGRGYTM